MLERSWMLCLADMIESVRKAHGLDFEGFAYDSKLQDAEELCFGNDAREALDTIDFVFTICRKLVEGP